MTTFVLVHGAWHGGWSWEKVRALLECEGHTVLTPTLTGLSERAHLLTPEVGIETHIDDICAVLHDKHVRDCVLVGHSYAGIIVTGVLARLRGSLIGESRIVRQAVYLDAVMIADGQCWADTHTTDQRTTRLNSCQVVGGTQVLPPPTPEMLSVFAPEDVRWVGALLTPHPARTYLDVLEASSAYQDATPRVYVDCIAPPLATLAGSKAFVRESGDWDILTLTAGHDCMVAEPRLTTDMLLRFG